jgi:hypothetical protein
MVRDSVHLSDGAEEAFHFSNVASFAIDHCAIVVSGYSVVSEIIGNSRYHVSFRYDSI